MNKKILSPFFYAVLLVPVLIGMVWIVSTLENSVGFLFQMNGFIEIPLIILTFGTFIFLLGTRGMCKFEQLQNPSTTDHFRQSSVHYLITLYCIVSLIFVGGTGSLGGAYLFMIASTSFWAIVVNAFYLFRRLAKHLNLKKN